MPERGTQDRVTRRRIRPSRDPECQRYIDDPAYSWYSGAWRTKQAIEARRAHQARYDQSEKRRAGNARYHQSEKGRAAHARYNNKRVPVRIGGMRFYYRVDPDKKKEIQERLAAFREHQARTRQEARENGWIN